MATKDFFELVKEGDFTEIETFLSNSHDLKTVRYALERDESLASTISGDAIGDTPLHWACAEGRLEVAKQLLIQGADRSIQNNAVSTSSEGRKRKHEDSSDRSVLVAETGSLLVGRKRKHEDSSDRSAETGSLRAQLEGMTRNRDAVVRERDTVTAERDTAVLDRNRAIAEKNIAVRDKNRVTAERDTAVRERDMVMAERDTAVRERDTVMAERHTAVRERDTVMAERHTAARDRNRAIAERDTAVRERDTVMAERDTAARDRNRAIAERDTAVRERDMIAERGVGLLEELEEWRTGRRVLGSIDAFERYRPYVHRNLPIPSGHRDIRLPLQGPSNLFNMVAGLCRTRGSYFPNPSPVAGFQLVRVDAVVPPDIKIRIFDEHKSTMTALRQTIPATTGAMPANKLRVLESVRQEYHMRSVEGSQIEARTLYVFHGPQVGAVDGICLNGLQATRAQDPGYFGAGSYCTLNIEYAARYARGEFDAQPLQRDFTATGGLVPVIMFAAAVNMVYPVTPDVDYPRPPSANGHSRFFGQPLRAGFDSHVACVSQSAGFEAVQREDCQYVELAVANYQQLLPLAVLWLRLM